MNMREDIEHEQWLMELKVGDEVAVQTSATAYGYPPYLLAKVARVTATQIALEGDSDRYERRSGLRRGGSAGYRATRRLMPVTQEVRDAIELHALVRWAGELVTNHGRTYPPFPVLRHMKKAYDEAMKQQEMLNPPA